MTIPDATHVITLPGLDGANPLGFLAAIGTASIAQKIWPQTKIHWVNNDGTWRPVLSGCILNEQEFISEVHTKLMTASMDAFDISNKLPFPASEFSAALRNAALSATPSNRRLCDFLSSFGCEVYPDKKSIFQDTRLRMVRSGDSAGQGLPVYAKAIRQATTTDHLRRTLFELWDYMDTSYSLRWDPIEDQRYALRWRDPSKSSGNDGPSSMVGANSLAIEAFPFFPTFMTGKYARTTSFMRDSNRETFFVWPIWTAAIDIHTLRALLTLPLLFETDPPRQRLEQMGIVEVFKCQRIQQNQYYSNFTPAQPV